MKNKKRVLLINPYINTLGGGEKHFLQIAYILIQKDCDITLHADSKTIIKAIKERLGLNFSSCHTINFYQKNSFQRKKFLSGFDIVFYVTDGSYFFSPAKNNYIFVMYPQKKLFNNALLNQLKWKNWQFICNSFFTKKHIDKWVNKKSQVIYPYIDDIFFKNYQLQQDKKLIIISVGRYFSQLHSKNHFFIIKSFNQLQQQYPQFKNFELILIGGLLPEDKPYFNKINSIAKTNKKIKVLSNISYQQLLGHYHQAMFYWHAAGLGIDEKKYPDKVEHLGITPLEAMATGSCVLAYPTGELSQLINSGKNGFFYKKDQDLISKTKHLFDNPCLRQYVCNQANKLIIDQFSYDNFKTNVIKIFKL